MNINLSSVNQTHDNLSLSNENSASSMYEIYIKCDIRMSNVNLTLNLVKMWLMQSSNENTISL